MAKPELTTVSSLANPRVRAARKLLRRTGRERASRFLVEGPHVIEEALDSGFRVAELFVLEGAGLELLEDRARTAGAEITTVSKLVLDAIATTTTSQGAVVVVEALPRSLGELPDELSLVLVLAQVRDPGNAGTLVRSAVAAGADAVIFATGSVDAFGPKTLRATAGTIFKVPIIEGVSTEETAGALRRRAIPLLAAVPTAPTSVYEVDLRGPVAFVVGNEAWGLDADTAAVIDASVSIPMSGPAESLNVAIAGALLLFETSRQRLGVSSRAMREGHD